MFTIEQIHNASTKIRSGADFPQFVQDLKSIGVIYYHTFVSDGNTCYFGEADFSLQSEPKYPVLAINPISSAEKLRQALRIHQAGQTDYPTFCQQAAEAGVEKWITHLNEMTVTYMDQKGNSLLVETIPNL